ncbi:TonB-dependent receptor domain-containing protein [Hyphococcus sp. DH-69]|uniref:TonB-dependent receptor domain-containing protein n=1 Tax=Hyphococcus formosus TaxID=3143534 RepID=UPI00398B5205
MLKSKLTLSGAASILPFLALGLAPAHAQGEQASQAQDTIVVTGSRIERSGLTSPTPVTSIGEQQIKTDRSVVIEDIFLRLPQAGGGANATGAAVGDSLGSSTIDLRGLGQNRTLVLVNGTRAVPFSFRNAVDTNTLPTGLIKNVEVLTGGAAAIYGADAVAGVVNFILDDSFEGLEMSVSGEVPSGGGESISADLKAGAEIGDGRGHVVGYLAYTERFELLAGERDFTSGTVTAVPSIGGNFTDVASGNFFAFDNNGAFSTERQTFDATPDRFLIQPMQRFHASVLFDYEVLDNVEVYGRAFYTDMKVTGAGGSGQTPISVNEEVTISETNPFIPAEALPLLTFVGGEATVNVERNLGLGLQRTVTSRDTFQLVGGIRGDITDNISWDMYTQYGRSEENATVFGNAIRNDSSGNSRFGAIADTVDIFGPDADFSDFGTEILYQDRTRDQLVASLIISGTTADVFELPAGPIGFAGGYEYREETGSAVPGIAVQNGLGFGLGSVLSLDNASFDTNEVFGEVLVPLLADLPFIQQLNFEGAFRHFDFSTTGTGNADKLGGTWVVNDQIRFRGQRQTTVRSPNLGEFAGPEVQLSLSLFDPTSPDFIPRLGGRFDGDPCLDGRGDAAQCAAQGAAAPGTPFDTSAAIYSFGGNPNIDTEKGETITVGMVLTPDFYPGSSLTVDYVDIEITDAVSQIQPIAALTNCYIDNPTPDNPLCGAVLRDPVTGLISQALVNDFNLASLKQKSIDVALVLPLDILGEPGEAFQLNYQATIVTDYTRQANATVDAVDCKGTFGGSCSGDFASFLQQDYKHRTDLNWAQGPFAAQFSWRRIGGVHNALDEADTISSQNYFDLTGVYDVTENVTVTAGIKNLFDKEPPLPLAGGNFFGTVSEYDAVGRSFGASVRARF